MIRASIVGATGYTGGELLRLITRHPDVVLTHVTSETYAGRPIGDIHKFLKGRHKAVCEKLNVASVARDSDVVFLCLPHGASAKTAAAFLDKGTRIIDLSADFRLTDLKVYEKWYGKHPVPKWISRAVFGLPERYRDLIGAARLVANPGCYATTSILAGLPIVNARGRLGRGPIIVDAASGVSGAGRKLENNYLFSEANESMMAYGLKGHRHHPEIWQEWNRVAKTAPRNPFVFVPHLAPLNRGIFATAYFPLAKKMTTEQLHALYVEYYRGEPFVTLLKAGESPEVKAVTYTNFCQIGVIVPPPGRLAIVMAVLDNLVKGASGQAIQNMNIMFGIDETRGLL